MNILKVKDGFWLVENGSKLFFSSTLSGLMFKLNKALTVTRIEKDKK